MNKELYNSLPEGGLYWSEAKLLWDWASKTSGKILEVGSAYGKSAVLLGTLAKQQSRNLICVDPWFGDHGEKLYRIFLKNIKDLPITAERKRIEDWDPQPVGFAYLDGDHSYEGTQAQIRKALACNPSVIAIHDFGEDHEQLIVAVATVILLGRPIARAERMAIYQLQ